MPDVLLVSWEGLGDLVAEYHGPVAIHQQVVCVAGAPVPFRSRPVRVGDTWSATISVPLFGAVTVRGLPKLPRTEVVAAAADGGSGSHVVGQAQLYTHPSVREVVDAELQAASDVFAPLDEAGVVQICTYGGPPFLKNHMQFGGDDKRRGLWLLVPRGVVTVDGVVGVVEAALVAATGMPLGVLLAREYPQLVAGGLSLGARRWNARVTWAEKWVDSPAEFDTFARPLVLWMADHVRLLQGALAALATAGPPDVAQKQALAEALAEAEAVAALVGVQERAAALVLDNGGFAHWSAALATAAADVLAARAAWLAVPEDPVALAVRTAVMALVGCSV